MNIPEEIRVFVTSIFYWIVVLIIFSLLFFFCRFEIITLYGIDFYLPFINENSFSVEVFNYIRYDLLPSDVQLITTNPMSALISQILVATLLAFMVTIPVFFYGIINYINPALLPREKKVVLLSLIPFVFLFISGSVFSYLLIIPATFEVLYPFAEVMGAIPLFSVNEFIQYVFSLMIGVGVMFLLPLFMILLSYLHIIKSEFWLKKWRYALLFFLVLSAIMTPDGTGITMLILFLPLAALYFIGYLFAKKLSK